MKKGLATLAFLILGLMAFAQTQAVPQWTRVLSDTPESFRIQLVSSSENSIKVNVQVPGFYMTDVTTPRGEAKVISMPKAVSTAKAGEPNVPMTGIPTIIGDRARMNIRVVEAQYMDFEGVEVAPSKGDFPRTIDPASVPYTYGECYSQDAFFPASNVGLYEPYIVRDFRGQNMVVYPYAYNPVSKTLRVYYDMTIEMYKVDDDGTNVMETRRSNTIKMDPDFKSMYQRHFINYQSAIGRYTPVDEEGDLLIICYDNFISNMTDFVNWKKTRGVNTTIVGTSTAGSTYSAIKTYIQNQYNANNNLTHVLLVGDVAQIPGYTYSGGGSSYAGKGDNAYGQIVGSDIYNDVFIGRFSASSAARVTTQCNRVITYERDLTTSASWLQVGEGISRKENGSGHNGEDDYQHMNNIRTDLLNYGYSPVYQRYANLTGYDGSSSTISSDINSGVGIINYANHGQETAWGANSSGYIYYSNSHVNALTNENKLPFIWSVACLVGKYDHSSDCFAEAWMNATNNNNPTGAIGTLMSYISQPWIPPMWAQDECVDILVESYNSNIKHTWGGTSINGLMGIFDHYSTSETSAVGTYQAWILYGDPSMMLRTKTPQAMTVTHSGSLPMGTNSYTVNVTNGSGALATITDANHNILGRATVNGTTATINVSGTLTANQQLTLCVFGYNKVTYMGTITVTGGTQYTISATASPSAGGTVSGAGTYYEGTECTLSATPNEHYVFTNWKLGNSVVSSNPTYTFTVTANASYTATFTAIPQYTISATANPAAGGTVSGAGSYYEGESCTLTATANEHYEFTNWKKGNTVVSTNPTYTFTVTSAGSYTANFTALTAHTVTCATVENGTISASPTTAYKNEVITLTATPASGYYFSSWNVRDANNNSITVTDNEFIMPDSNVTVSATFVPGYSVTLASSANGTISANPTGGPAGTTITLTATPATGYVLNSWVVYKTGDLNTTITVTNNSFTLPAYDVTVVGIFTQPQGGDVTIGSGTTTNNGNYLPTSVNYEYSLTQQIYTAAELGDAATIIAIGFYYNTATASNDRNLQVYMSHTTNSTITSWSTVSSSQLVYSGTHTFTQGWNMLTLTTPFVYDGTSNILLTVDDNTGATSSNGYFRTYSTSAQRAIRYRGSSTNPNPTGNVTVNASSVRYNAQLTITKATPSTEGTLNVTPANLVGFETVSGTASEPQSVAVIGANLQSNVTVTPPTGYEVCATASGNYATTLTLTPSNGSLQQMVYVRLKASLTQGNYNGTMAFASGTTTASVSLSGTVTQGSVTYYDITATANPTNGGTVTGAGNYAAGTTVTLTATPNTGYFFTNWTKNGSVVSTNATYSFTVNGTGAYVANFTLNSYSIIAAASPIDGGTVSGAGTYNHGATATLVATANTGYSFSNWTKDGIIVSTNATYSFTVTEYGVYIANFEEEVPTVEQSIVLNAGWNWWTPAVDISGSTLLNLLENGMGSNGVVIMSQDGTTATNSTYGWSGLLGGLEAGKMYMIKVNADCSFTLEGSAIDPSEHSVTLYHGTNWIGFVGSGPMSVNNALVNLDATVGDMIIAQDGSSATYSIYGWGGVLTNLTPGQAYIYNSQATSSKTFTYPASK